MTRRLTRCSFVLLIAVLVYWLIAYSVSPDFSNLAGDDPAFPSASASIGGWEIAWVMDRRMAMVALTHNPGGEGLPLLGRANLASALFNPPPGVRWTSEFETSGALGVGTLTLRGQTSAGGPIVFRLFYTGLWLIVAILAILPLIALLRIGLQRSTRAMRAIRVRRLRHARARIGRCVCGYDLRSSRRRCPECGRAIRWLPVSMPDAKRRA